MFTAWGSQTPVRQIGYKGTTKNAYTQKKSQKVAYSAILLSLSKLALTSWYDKLVVITEVNYPTTISGLIFLMRPLRTSPGPNS